jgi:hypothetical protein
MAPSAGGFAGEADLSRWIEQRSKISGLELVFRVPPGYSASTPGLPLVPGVDLERDLDSKTHAIAVFAHAWDFRGRFWQGKVGGLTLTIGVRTKPDSYPKDLTALDNLRELIQRKLEEFHLPRNEELRRKSQAEHIVTLPEGYPRITIHNREWLVYSMGGPWKDSRHYATPLTSAHYLEVGFNFVDNSKSQGHKTTWRRDAQAVADQVAASLELRKVE